MTHALKCGSCEWTGDEPSESGFNSCADVLQDFDSLTREPGLLPYGMCPSAAAMCTPSRGSPPPGRSPYTARI